ncbi:Bifunctional dehydrogenase and ferrochelatase, partial [Serendipita sp. 400]
MSAYPEIRPGCSLLIAWQLKDKRVVLVGGGQVAAGRLVHLLQADALVTLIAPSSNLNNEVRYRITTDPLAMSRITWLDRLYEGPHDLDGAEMVLTAIDDNEASLKIWEDAKGLKIPVNVADVPPNCDFYFGSLIRRGALQVMVSTNGRGPKLAALIRQRLEDALPPDVDVAIEKVGRLRELLRDRAPGVGGKLGRDRMQWMTSICETWDLGELAQLDEPSMRRLLDEGWDHNKKVLKHDDIFGRRFWKHAFLEESDAIWFAGGVLIGGLLAIMHLRRRI